MRERDVLALVVGGLALAYERPYLRAEPGLAMTSTPPNPDSSTAAPRLLTVRWGCRSGRNLDP